MESQRTSNGSAMGQHCDMVSRHGIVSIVKSEFIIMMAKVPPPIGGGRVV